MFEQWGFHEIHSFLNPEESREMDGKQTSNDIEMHKLKIDKAKFLMRDASNLHAQLFLLVITILLSNYYSTATSIWHLHIHTLPKIKGYKNRNKEEETCQGHSGQSWSHL